MKILQGKINRPLKVVIYGAEGIGKTTFASQFPDPLFIDTEGGTAHMDVRRVQAPATWQELLSIVSEVAADSDVCKTLIIDTADWAESLCVNAVCLKYKQPSIEGFGYGKGYTYLAEEFTLLLRALDAVIASGKNVVITAHAKMRKFELPDEQGAYDRWEMKLSKQTAPLLKEWCDMLLFLNYKTYVVENENGTHKAQGGKRVIYTAHHPCWDAKNRLGLPEELEMDFSSIAHIFKSEYPNRIEKPIDKIRDLMKASDMTEEQLIAVCIQRQKCNEGDKLESIPDGILTQWMIPHWDKILKMINLNNKVE